MAESISWSDWNEKGMAHFKKQEWLEAIDCYTSALKLKSDQAILFSNRAISKTRANKLKSACEDAKSAIRLDPKNIKFYRILSEALIGLGSFSEALKECERGLKLDPRDPKLLIRQRDCQVKISSQKRPSKVNKDSKPKDQSHSSCECGHHKANSSKAGGEKSSKAEKSKIASKPVKRERRYSYGSMIKGGVICAMGHNMLKHPNHDEEGALEYYQQAADLGNPEGMFYVGMMHLGGKAGLHENPKKALEIFREISDLEEIIQQQPFEQAVQGVGDAQNQIGEAYCVGVGVEQSETEALNWYRKAAQNGSIDGCANLGNFLYFGRGTEEDREKACYWFNMSTKLQERRTWNFKEDEDSKDEVPLKSRAKPTRKLNKEEVKDAMMKRYLQGSASAKLYFAAQELLTEARELLQEEKFNESFLKLRDMWRSWKQDGFEREPFCEASRKIVENEPNNHLAIYVRAMLDSELDVKERLKFAERCIELDSTVADYHFLLADCCGSTGNLEKALKGFDRAIELLPQPGWIFARAVFLEKSGHRKFKVGEIIDSFRHFLSCVPSDNPNVPAAYYYLAELYAWTNELDFVTDVYRKGLETEDPSVKLPCIQDPIVSPKEEVQEFLKLRKRWPLQDNEYLFIMMCEACTKTRCSFVKCNKCRKITYCSEKCLNNHKIVHKKDCRP